MSYLPTIEYNSEGIAHATAEGIRKGVSVVWVNNDHNAGNEYNTSWYPYPFRIVLHEIQGGANAGSIAGHPYPPHVWYDSSRRILFQTVPLGRSAFALYQDPNAPHYTNKARALQVELNGVTEGVANEPIEVLNNIAEDVVIPICSWTASKGSPIDLTDLPPYPWVIANSARVDAPQRYTVQRWADCKGICTHAQVPMGDDHYDTGAMNVVWIAQHAALLIGAILDGQDPTAKEKDSEMPDVMVQDSDGTQWGISREGIWRKVPGTLVDHWRNKGVQLINMPANWTQWSKDNKVIA